MVKTKVVYACSQCGGQSPKWSGQCPDCGAWNSLVEELPVSSLRRAGSRTGGYAGESA